uniref:Uncharacterized protein n=1 Tax=Homalodisca liturata TaxID=320908 RepID=A0A1B6HCM5_9HEMI
MLCASSAEEAYNSVNIVTQALNSTFPLKTLKFKNKQKPKHFADQEAFILKNSYVTAQTKYEQTGNLRDKENTVQFKKSNEQSLKALRKNVFQFHLKDLKQVTSSMASNKFCM